MLTFIFIIIWYMYTYHITFIANITSEFIRDLHKSFLQEICRTMWNHTMWWSSPAKAIWSRRILWWSPSSKRTSTTSLTGYTHSADDMMWFHTHYVIRYGLRWPQDGLKMAPRWAQDGPKMAPKMPQNGPKMAPRWSQDGPKIQDGAKIARDSPR